MLAELISTARAADLSPGECLEVHWFPANGPGYEVGASEVVPVVDFVDRWDYAMDLDCFPSRLRPWLGIVHDDGAMLVPLGK